MDNENETKEITKKWKSFKFENWFSTAVKVVVSIFCLIIGILAIVTTVYFEVELDLASEVCHFALDNIFITIPLLIILVAMIYFGIKKLSNKVLLIILIIMSVVLSLLWVNYIQLLARADQFMMVYCADNLLNHSGWYALNPGEYLNRNPHQLGFVLYVMTVFKILNTRSNMIVLQNLNIVYSLINQILIYFICKKLFKEEKVHKICLILLTVFSMYWTFFNTHIYGNIPGLMFALVAILFTLKFLEDKKIINLVVIGISLTISYLLKNNFQIFMLGILIVLFLYIMQTHKLKYLVAIISIIMLIFGSKSLIYKRIEKGTGFSLHEGVPMIAYVYMGIAPYELHAPGWYTADVVKIYDESGYNTEKSREISKELLADRLEYLVKNPKYTADYFGRKFLTTWLNPTFQTIWCSLPSWEMKWDEEYREIMNNKSLLEPILVGDVYDVLERIFDSYQILIFLCASVGIFLNRKNTDLKMIIIPIIFLGGLAFHLIWETKSIYVIQYYYLLLPFAAYGLYRIFCFAEEKFKNMKKNKEIKETNKA